MKFVNHVKIFMIFHDETDWRVSQFLRYFLTSDWWISRGFYFEWPNDTICNVFPVTEWRSLWFFSHNSWWNLWIFRRVQLKHLVIFLLDHLTNFAIISRDRLANLTGFFSFFFSKQPNNKFCNFFFPPVTDWWNSWLSCKQLANCTICFLWSMDVFRQFYSCDRKRKRTKKAIRATRHWHYAKLA